VNGGTALNSGDGNQGTTPNLAGNWPSIEIPVGSEAPLREANRGFGSFFPAPAPYMIPKTPVVSDPHSKAELVLGHVALAALTHRSCLRPNCRCDHERQTGYNRSRSEATGLVINRRLCWRSFRHGNALTDR
jgi:hypothetical protein